MCVISLKKKLSWVGQSEMPFPLCPVCFNDGGGDVSKQKVFEDTRSVARGGGKDGIVVVGNISPRSGHQVILFALTFDFSQPGYLYLNQAD